MAANIKKTLGANEASAPHDGIVFVTENDRESDASVIVSDVREPIASDEATDAEILWLVPPASNDKTEDEVALVVVHGKADDGVALEATPEPKEVCEKVRPKGPAKTEPPRGGCATDETACEFKEAAKAGMAPDSAADDIDETTDQDVATTAGSNGANGGSEGSGIAIAEVVQEAAADQVTEIVEGVGEVGTHISRAITQPLEGKNDRESLKKAPCGESDSLPKIVSEAAAAEVDDQNDMNLSSAVDTESSRAIEVIVADQGEDRREEAPDTTSALGDATSFHSASLSPKLSEVSCIGTGLEVFSFAVSPGGKYVAIGGRNGRVTVRELASGFEVCAFSIASRPEANNRCFVTGLSFSSDGSQMIAAGHSRSAQLWDVNTWQLVRRLSHFDSKYYCAAFSPDGRTIAIAGRCVRIWNATTGRAERTLGESLVRKVLLPFTSRSLLYLPDDTLLADATVWNVQTGERLRTFDAPDLGILGASRGACLSLSPDNSTVAGAGFANDVLLWSYVDGAIVDRISKFGGTSRSRHSICWSPGGRYLAVGGGSVQLWDRRERRVLRPTVSQPGCVFGVGFTPDGLLVTGQSSGKRRECHV